MGEHRIVIRGVSSDLYVRLSDAIDEHEPVDLTDGGKDLEILALHHEKRDHFGSSLIPNLHAASCPSNGDIVWFGVRK